jgi:hypothetical protein
MQNKKISIWIVFFLFLFFGIKLSQAITVLQPTIENDEGEIIFDESDAGEVVADIGLYNAEIIEKSEEKLKIYFEIKNNESKTQSDLVYAVEIIEKIDGPVGISRAKKVYDEKINLIESQQIEKEIEFQIPQHLSGDFEVLISLADTNGLLMALNSIDEIHLENSSSFIEISMEKCYLTIKGESENQKYSMVEGVVVDENEDLIVNCEVENHFNESKNIKPELKFYKRSLYGDQIDFDFNVDSEFTFKANEIKLLQFSLPKPEKPQAYSVLMNLTEGNEVISNQAEIHFVVGGSSATVQNISLDKNYYKKGEKMGLSLLLSGPADVFPNSRIETTELSNIFVEVFVFNSDNNFECVSLKDTISSNYPIAEYDNLEVLNDCYNPQVTVVLRDESDNILDERTVKIESQKQNIKKEELIEKKENNKDLIWISVIFISSIVFLISAFLLLKKIINKNKF